MKLRTYTGDFVKPTGFCSVTVQNRGQSEEPPIYVMKNEGPALFGREWLDSTQLDWPLTSVRNTRHHSYPGKDVLKNIQALIQLQKRCFALILESFKPAVNDALNS